MTMNDIRATQLLLVEDDDDDFILAKDYLSEIPFLDITIERSTNVEAALQALSERDFDLCLVDYRLGAMTGIDLLKRAKEHGFSGPIIMLTSQSDEELDQIALGAGAADYLVKGELTSARFARSIRYALARRDVEAERVERIKAEQEVRAKDRFLAHLSHELRTPLTAILGYTELLLHTKSEHSNELNVIHRNGKHLLNLLNDVLDLSKIAANKLELAIMDVELNPLLADIYALMQMSALDKGLQLNIHAPEPLPKTIQTDPTRLRQVLINLISNSIKFTDNGRIDVTISTATRDEQKYLIFMVQDSGIGISEQQIKEVFKPFVQVADVITRSIGGSGLGLAISNELVRRMGGNIRVTSQLDHGSCFSVRIPLNGDTPRVPLDLTAQTDQRPSRTNPQQLTGHVLVTDDLRDIRTLIGHMVTRLGPEVSFASNGQEAIQKVLSADNHYDVIFMDIHMPLLDGVSAVKKLRAQGILTPVIALTAANMKGSREHFLEQGFSGVLSKPVDAQLLTKKLSRYLPYQTVPADSNSPALQRVLIVEDDNDAALAISGLLEVLGLETQIASTVGDAIAALQQSDLWTHIFLDLHLGSEDGLTVASYAQQHCPHAKTVIMSGADISDAQKNEYDIHATLKKPIQLAEITTMLK